MSILAMPVRVGVPDANLVVPHDNDAKLQPIVTSSQRRRICAELCMSGLGGEPRAQTCLGILPQGIPLQFPDSSPRKRSIARRDASFVLCTLRPD